MMATRKRTRFQDLPTAYADLCQTLLPRPIHDADELENVAEIAEAMAGQDLNSDQADYFDLLCNLIESYEQSEMAFSELSGLEALRHLLAEHSMSGSDLSRLLGAHRTLGPMILRGERKLTAEHIRLLASHFSVSTDLFITEG